MRTAPSVTARLVRWWLVLGGAAASVLLTWLLAPAASAGLPPPAPEPPAEVVADFDAACERNAARLGSPIDAQPAWETTYNFDTGVHRFDRGQQRFTGGTVYWAPYTGAHFLDGPIAAVYEDAWNLGYPSGLGRPTTDVRSTKDGRGRYIHFHPGTTIAATIAWSPSTGARLVWGGVRAKWAALGFERGVGYPTSHTAYANGLDWGGQYAHFTGRGGATIASSDAHGTYVVSGTVRKRWAAEGWEDGLGWPIADVARTPDGKGWYGHFRRDEVFDGLRPLDSSVYWTEKTGARVVSGAVRAKWASIGWERSVVGYPTTDTARAKTKGSRFNHFSGSGGASIYVEDRMGEVEEHPSAAHVIHGAVRAEWARTGWERGPLGWPMTDQQRTPEGKGQYVHFDTPRSWHGSIYYHPSHGAHGLWGGVRAQFARDGWEKGPCGWPTTTQSGTPDRKWQYAHFSGRGGCSYYAPNGQSDFAYDVAGKVRERWARLGWENSWAGYPEPGMNYYRSTEEGIFQHGSIAYDTRTQRYTEDRRR